MKILFKNIKLLFALFFTLLFLGYYFSVFSKYYDKPIRDFKNAIHKLENQADDLIKSQIKKNALKRSTWDYYEQNKGINIHVYHNDSLIYWNTNQVPVSRFADIHFPSQGILHLQNGWYFGKVKKKGEYVYCASFLIKRDYSYENKELINQFVAPFELPFSAYISMEEGSGFPIYNNKKEYVFSVLPNEYQTSKGVESVLLSLFLLLAITFWLVLLFDFISKKNDKIGWSILSFILMIRILSIKLIWFGFMHENEFFASKLYGTNEWFPNFFEYFLNTIIITFTITFLTRKIIEKEYVKWGKVIGIICLLFSFLFLHFIVFLNKGLIENSSIPLLIEKLFDLNAYSVLAIFTIGLLYYVFFQFTKSCIILLKSSEVTSKMIYLLNLSLAGFFVLFELNWGIKTFSIAFFPFIFYSILTWYVFTRQSKFYLAFGLMFLFLFSILTTSILREHNFRKERLERELYAEQLASEKDITTEIEYSNIKSKIAEDNYLKEVVSKAYISNKSISLVDFENNLEKRFFNGFWERYDMSFNLVNPIDSTLILRSEEKNDLLELTQIIDKHGTPSEIDSSIFFINDYTRQYSYIVKQPIYLADSSFVYLYCTFKSKKIPEEIGFPRLLISSQAKVFDKLENYSIAKYFQNHLVVKYGKFNYPSSDLALNNWKPLKTGYYETDDFNHYAFKKTNDDVIVLSIPNSTWLEFVTSFSYLFVFFGILLLPIIFHFKISELFTSSFTLALKIQIVLIALVFISLLAFGWGSGIFVSNQYNDLTNDVIREKIKSVDAEIKEKVGLKNELSLENDGNNLNLALQRLAKVFLTDINIYDKKGFLIASSRQKVFNIGLISEQMNADAFYQVDVRDRSEYIHQENIGNLNYSSAYSPIYNNDRDQLAYLNLQHFGKQKEFEVQIQRFLVAIINVFMLLLVISIIISIFVSNWVTSPLRLLQNNLIQLKFGQENKPIEYQKNDEIGALVKNYNQKLSELEFTAQQLAKSERESAWREMAKQVAHEIKNPLTPMKLSIQHLQRIYDPNDPQSKVKLDKVANSIIEQIDALTNIANEFSNFAKLPKPNEEKLDLLTIIKNVIQVFEAENIEITLVNQTSECFIIGDKDLMIRVFNNLIKNAIQAIPEEKEGKINIQIVEIENNYHIEVRDNGTGISLEKQEKIFVPYFTTKGTGTGLGLAMVKQIVESHNGKIWFETIENIGTKFIIELPISLKSTLNYQPKG